MNKKFSVAIIIIAVAAVVAAGYFYLQTRTLARQMNETSAALHAEIAELQDVIKKQAALLEEQSAQIEVLKAEQLAAASAAEELPAPKQPEPSPNSDSDEKAADAEESTNTPNGNNDANKTIEEIERELLEQAIRDSMGATGNTGGQTILGWDKREGGDGTTGQTKPGGPNHLYG